MALLRGGCCGAAAGGVVSHETALSPHDISDANPARVHLTVPKGFRASDPAVVTHIEEIDAHDFEVRGSWRLTTERKKSGQEGYGAGPPIPMTERRCALSEHSQSV